MNLSSMQKKIVEASIGSAVQVLASAGTGKTRVLTERIRYIANNTKKDGVIALTFTNKAADEMKARLIDYELDEDRLWVANIHSVAQRILEKYSHTVGLPTELNIYDKDKDRMEMFLQSLREGGIDIDSYLDVGDSKELRSREKNLSRYMEIFSRIKRELLTELDIANQYPDRNVWKIYQDYQAALLNCGGIDYDDILVYAHKILLTHEWVARVYRAQYKHICVDEAQDLNKAQYELIRALCGDDIKSVLMVGDPNQMIYGFNGSSKDFLCSHFVEDFSPLQFKLTENYRSSKAVIDVANKLKPGSQTGTDYALKGWVQFYEQATEQEEAEAVVRLINEILALGTHTEIEGEITLDNMVVIGRNRFVFSELEKLLKDHAIPYLLRKGERHLEPSTRFGKVLDYAIRVKINPKDWVGGKKLCLALRVAEPESWEEGVLQRLATQIPSKNKETAQVFSELLLTIDALDIEEPNIIKLTKHFDGLLKSLVSNQGGNSLSDTQQENIKLSLEELDEFKSTWLRFNRKGLGSSLVAFRNALALGQLSDDPVNTGLTLSTVHTMKGLEKDIVFLIGMCEGVFPDYRAKTKEEIEEERNNAFVAVTRAKRWLYISYPKQRMMPWGDLRTQQGSRFIREMRQ